MFEPGYTEVVVFYRFGDGIEDYFIETVEARKEGAFFKLVNAPVFAPNLSAEDIVRCREENGKNYFEELIHASEFSTIQILVNNLEQKKGIELALAAYECDVNPYVAPNFIVLTVYPDADYRSIQKYLMSKVREDAIQFKEASLRMKHKASLM